MLFFVFALIDDLTGPGAAEARGRLTVHGDLGCFSSPSDEPFVLAHGVLELLHVVRRVALSDGVGQAGSSSNANPFLLHFCSRGDLVAIDDIHGHRLHRGRVTELVAAAQRDVVPFARHLCWSLGPTDATAELLRDELDDFEAVLAIRV